MTISDMHYDFKQKLNKIDSEQYRNLRIPEIDWLLNEAQLIFVKNIAQPRVVQHTGFEISQRSIDDIRTIVIEDKILNKLSEDNKYSVFELPEDYLFYISTKVKISKNGCGSKEVQTIVRQHDDLFEQSKFDNSSFEWGEVNITFDSRGLKVYTDGTFTIDELKINYIKQPMYIHNANEFKPTSQYKLPNGILLVGQQNSELPNHTHNEIVDIAVYIATNNLDMPNMQFKQAKLQLNQMI